MQQQDKPFGNFVGPGISGQGSGVRGQGVREQGQWTVNSGQGSGSRAQGTRGQGTRVRGRYWGLFLLFFAEGGGGVDAGYAEGGNCGGEKSDR